MAFGVGEEWEEYYMIFIGHLLSWKRYFDAINRVSCSIISSAAYYRLFVNK